MKTADFDYELPGELIAQFPVEPRDSSRLLVLGLDGKIEHRIFRDITEYLEPGDVLVVNETKVIPARLFGRKTTGANVEVFLLKRLSLDEYECMVRPGRRLRKGSTVIINSGDGAGGSCSSNGSSGSKGSDGSNAPSGSNGSGGVVAHIEEELDGGLRRVRFESDEPLEVALSRVGHIPLPPYITSGYDNIERYNTVYAREDGSAAAPTAGLHFTDELLERVKAKGVKLVKILLHVGLGTFRPVEEEEIEKHHMHTEFYSISKEAADAINSAKGRVICVGTTSCRALESAAKPVEPSGESARKFRVEAGSGDTSIFIYPGYEFKMMEALITNFHLPKSTLLMLVSAFEGRDKILNAYNEAVRERYRFFSFGDAMFLTGR